MGNTSNMPQTAGGNAPGNKVPTAGDVPSYLQAQTAGGNVPGSAQQTQPVPAMTNDPFTRSAGNLAGASGVYGQQMAGNGAGGQYLNRAGNVFGQQASGMSAGSQLLSQTNNAASDMSNLGGRVNTGGNYLAESAGRLRELGNANLMQSTMSNYANPYQSQVIDQGVGRIMDSRNESLNSVGGQAAQMNAFGGSRQGVIEGQIYSNANRDAGELAATMGRQGFLDRGNLASTDIGMQQNAAQAQGNAGASLMGNSLNAMGTQAGIAGQQFNQQNTGAINNQRLGEQRFNQQNIGAQNAQALGMQQFGIGNTLNQNQMQSGMLQQGLNQQVLDAGRNQFDAYAQRPQDMLNIIMSGLGGSPLQGNNTQTQEYKPGLFDYLSLASQMGSSYLGNM